MSALANARIIGIRGYRKIIGFVQTESERKVMRMDGVIAYERR